MQKTAAIVAVLSVLALAARVEAYPVFVAAIIIHTTEENGGTPEIFMACDVGTPYLLVESLTAVNDVNVPYYRDPVLYLDADLRPSEEHVCVIYESDSFSFDFDREDAEDDIIGYFTVSRSDFVNDSLVTKVLPGGFSVLLGCYLC